MKKAIVHTGTGVIRSLTEDSEVQLRSDESLIEVADDFSLSDGPWMLQADGRKAVPTKEEVEYAIIIPKAIIHKDTRVIRRLTTDIEPTIGKDEEIVQLERDKYLDPTIAPEGYKKVDKKGNILPATEKEIDDSDVDEARKAVKLTNKQQVIRNLVEDMSENGATPDKLQAYFQGLRDLM